MIGLIIDDREGKKAFAILTSKILKQAGITAGVKISWTDRGNKLNIRKMKAHIDSMLRNQPDIEKIIVCMDSEDENLTSFEPEVKKVEQQLAHRRPRPIYLLVVRMLESWLLADEAAIRDVLGPRAQVKSIPNPETIRNPKEKLDEIFQGARKTFLYTRDNPKIAQAVKDLDLIKKKCPRFAQFYEAVVDP